jgi:hypothetical protein
MTQPCPRCGNTNDDAAKFCTTCGNPLDQMIVQPVTSATPQLVLMSPTAPPGPDNAFRLMVIAVVAIIVILAALSFLQASGIVRTFPFLSPAVTPRITPVAISSVTTDTSLPETTPARQITPAVAAITGTPVTSPPPTKAVVCPSDRRTCDNKCTDIMTDQNNCGACGVPCGSSQTCLQGICLAGCTDEETSCPNGCHNLSYDAQNCGACGNSCPVGLACNKSVCAPTLATTIPTYSG